MFEILVLIGLAAILVVCIVGFGCCAHNTNETCDFLKKQEHFMDEWREEWRAETRH
jgi:hypothetical protein